MSKESKYRPEEPTNTKFHGPSRITRRSKMIKKMESQGPWTPKEQERFLEGIKRYGNSWKDVAAYVGSRNANQCCSHSQKHFMRIRRLKAEEMRNNPETKDHVFVVVKYFYNTALIQKERILSYQHRKVTPSFEEENAPQEEEESEFIDNQNKKSEELIKSTKNLRRETKLEADEDPAKDISETKKDDKDDYPHGIPILYPVPYHPIQLYSRTIICPPAHFNPFANYPGNY